MAHSFVAPLFSRCAGSSPFGRSGNDGHPASWPALVGSFGLCGARRPPWIVRL